MAERKIRHSLVRYSVDRVISGRKQKVFEVAFRNQVVDIPDDQLERLDALGATVAPDDELSRPGTMLALAETAGDAEILSWVLGASNDEIKTLVEERPAMAGRILSAQESVAARFAEQNEHLGGSLRTIADEEEKRQEELAEEQRKAAEAAAAAGAPPATPPLGGAEDLIGGPAAADLTTEQADEIVKANAEKVTNYISENPRFAAAVLEAEGRRAVAEKRDPRVSVVRAAEAAAGFTQ